MRRAVGTIMMVLLVIGAQGMALPGAAGQDEGYGVITSENAVEMEVVGTLGYGNVYDVAWSPDGGRLAVGTSTGLWMFDDLSDPPRKVWVSSGRISSVDFSPDGETVLVAGRDAAGGYIRLLDTATGVETEHIELEGMPSQVEFYGNGENLIIGGSRMGLDGDIVVWNLEERYIEWQVEGSYPPFAVSHDSKRLAWAETWQVVVAQLDESSPEPDIVLESEVNLSDAPIAFSPDDSRILVAGNPVNLQNGQVGPSMANYVWSIESDPLSGRLIFGEFNGITEVDPESGRETSAAQVPAELRLPWGGGGDVVLDVELHPGGEQVAVVSETAGLLLWSGDVDEMMTPLMPLIDPRPLAFSPDGQTLAQGTAGGMIYRWDMAGREPVASWRAHEGNILDMAYDANNRLASIGQDGKLHLWADDSGQPAGTFDAPRGRCNYVRFDATDEAVLVVDNEGLKRIELATGESQRITDEKVEFPCRYPFSDDGKLYAGRYGLWATDSGEQVAQFEGPILGIAPDGQTVMTRNPPPPDRNSALWIDLQMLSVESGEVVSSSVYGGNVCGYRMHPYGEVVAIERQIWSGGGYNSLDVWDVRENTVVELAVLAWSDVSSCPSVAYHPAGELMAFPRGSSIEIIDLNGMVEVTGLAGALGGQDDLFGHTLVFSPDGTRLVSIPHHFGIVEIWAVGE